MYKLFLCLRYLRSRIIAYLAMVAVALCVFMVLVAVSVMNGFLHKIEVAAKGLYGDIDLDTRNFEGIPQYDALIERIQKLPDVEHATPFIVSGGLLQIPGQPHIRIPVQIAGIRLPQQAQVTSFGQGLFVQGSSSPTFNPPVPRMIDAIHAEMAKTRQIIQRQTVSPSPGDTSIERLETALSFQAKGQMNLLQATTNAKTLEEFRAQLRAAQDDANASPETVKYLERQIQDLQTRTIEPPPYHIILGQAISGLIIRTDKGETVRYMVPGAKIVLGVFPMGRGISTTSIPFNQRMFTVVDDSRTDVWSTDSTFVYLPFETLQALNNMDQPNRCSQIHIKVRGEADERRLRQITAQIEKIWEQFRGEAFVRRAAAGADATADDNAVAATELLVQTWRQKQEALISPIEAQRTLVTIMFGIISLVAVVLIFVIFYMIVMQKTREIGIVKAVGASSGGVASIFLAYGTAVGLVGATLGSIGAVFFVHHINPIHDWMSRVLGFTVWSRKTFMFEKIPNTVETDTIFFVVTGAMVAGLVGAIIPALRAARMQPVEAIRYE